MLKNFFNYTKLNKRKLKRLMFIKKERLLESKVHLKYAQ